MTGGEQEVVMAHIAVDRVVWATEGRGRNLGGLQLPQVAEAPPLNRFCFWAAR
jgi:hypothetical protein